MKTTNVLYGAETLKAKSNFTISPTPMPRAFLEALGRFSVKYYVASDWSLADPKYRNSFSLQ